MLNAIGIDIVEVARMQGDLDRYGDRFVRRILSSSEQVLLAGRVDKAAFMAGRFACKEAVIKALGRFITDRPSYQAIDVVNDDSGQPIVQLPSEVITSLRGGRVMVSISHEKNYAVAMATISDASS